VDADGNGVYAEGVWRPDNPTKQNTPAMETVSQLSCQRYGGKALVGSEAWCLQAEATTSDGILSVHTTWLKVVEWSKTQLIAIDDGPICLTAQVICDLKNKTVMDLDVRKPNATGWLNSCKEVPDRQTYYFQNTMDYYVKKVFADE